MQQQMQSQQQQQQQHQSQMQQNHMNPQNHMNTQQILNHALNNSGGLQQMQMQPMQSGMYDGHGGMHPNVNINGVGLSKDQQPMVYLGGQPPMNVMGPQNQYMTAARNAAVSFILFFI